ncbi:MAG: hypothetical protein C5B52_15675 [Bacteroidetes bacterium]|nr:MAG: hypothetical protein C5B52_15675 [Bacteroidota bacterium]
MQIVVIFVHFKICCMRAVSAHAVIKASCHRILEAFISMSDLKNWWSVSRSLIETARGGLYSLAWKGAIENGYQYVASGIIDSFIPGEELIIAKFVYFNFEKNILGPFRLTITVKQVDPEYSKIDVVQSGYQDGGDWDWYYTSVVKGWPQALGLLKDWLENNP